MRLPPQSQPVNREGREDLYLGTVEPAWIWDKITGIGRRIARTAACRACNFIPNRWAKRACRAVACR